MALSCAIRSPRTTVSSSKAIRPSDSATACTMVALGLRCSEVMAKRQLWFLEAPLAPGDLPGLRHEHF